MTPDPACLFLTPAHREALAGLTYAILSRKGFVVLTGDAGTGKTTLLRRVFGSIPSARIRFSMVLNPTLTPSGISGARAARFRHHRNSRQQSAAPDPAATVSARSPPEKPAGRTGRGRSAQAPHGCAGRASPAQQLRAGRNKTAANCIGGQTELADLLDRQDLRQLKQRISVRLAIHPLSPTGVEHYIAHRWQKAGATKPHPVHAGSRRPHRAVLPRNSPPGECAVRQRADAGLCDQRVPASVSNRSSK